MLAVIIGMFFIALPALTVAAESSDPVVAALAPSPSVSEMSASADEMSEAKEPTEEEAFHIPIILNDSVEAYIEFFLGRGKNMFQQWLDNSAPSLPLMKEIFRRADLPEELVYVAMIESGLDPDAVSRAKATGPWQFMPDTARRYGLRSDWWVDERKEITKSTRAAALFLRDLHARLGSWPLVLAAYNAGAGRVQRAMLGTGSDDFWDLRYSPHLRRETKNFVPKFMAAAIIARDPAAYGFRPPVARPVRFDEVVIRNSMDLGVVAYCADSTYEMIKSLNPELTGRSTPPDDRSYVLKIPEGKKKIFLARSDTLWKAVARLHQTGAAGEVFSAPRTCSIFETTLTLAERGFQPVVNGTPAWTPYPTFTGKDSRTAAERPFTLCINRTRPGTIKQYLGTGTLSYFSNTADLRR